MNEEPKKDVVNPIQNTVPTEVPKESVTPIENPTPTDTPKVVQENNDKPKESAFKDNPIIVLLIFIILAIIGYVVYTNFIQKPNNSSQGVPTKTAVPNKPKVSSDTSKPDKLVYKTSDSKFRLEIVELDNEKAKEDFAKTGINVEANQVNIKKYAYFNDTIFAIDEINEDENYATYRFVAYPNEDYGKIVLVNKKNKRIEVPKDMLNEKTTTCINNGFCGFILNPSFINTVLGYFFTSNDNGLITLYTKDWVRIGYVNIDLSNDAYAIEGLDEKGVTAYSAYKEKECTEEKCTYDLLNPSKYDAKGNRIGN